MRFAIHAIAHDDTRAGKQRLFLFRYAFIFRVGDELLRERGTHGERRIRPRQQRKERIERRVLRFRIIGSRRKNDLVFHRSLQRSAAQDLQLEPGDRLTLRRFRSLPACEHAEGHAIHYKRRALKFRGIRRCIRRRDRFFRRCRRGVGCGRLRRRFLRLRHGLDHPRRPYGQAARGKRGGTQPDEQQRERKHGDALRAHAPPGFRLLLRFVFKFIPFGSILFHTSHYIRTCAAAAIENGEW